MAQVVRYAGREPPDAASCQLPTRPTSCQHLRALSTCLGVALVHLHFLLFSLRSLAFVLLRRGESSVTLSHCYPKQRGVSVTHHRRPSQISSHTSDCLPARDSCGRLTPYSGSPVHAELRDA